MSDALTWRDARSVFRILADLAQLRHDTLAWRNRMLTELGALVGAHVGVGGEAPAGRFLDASSHAGSVDTGWATGSDRRAWMSVCARSEPDIDPADATIARLGRCSYTRSRQWLVTDTDWYSSVIFNEHYRPAGIDHYIVSHREIPEHRCAHYFFLFRSRSDRPFTERDRKLVHHFHRELGLAWREAAQHRLPRRQEQTLVLLQAGLSEKEVADRLELSPSTVHDYCKALHRRFDVRSRPELLARAMALPQAPRLALQDARAVVGVR
jgi:DNA-binding CsgD family transcriptional regulator